MCSETAKTSYQDVIFIGSIMVEIQQILDRDQSVFPNGIFSFHYVNSLNASPSWHSHEGFQPSLSSGKCSRSELTAITPCITSLELCTSRPQIMVGL